MRGILTTLAGAFLTAILVAAFMVRVPEPPPPTQAAVWPQRPKRTSELSVVPSAIGARGSWMPSNASIGISYLASDMVSGSRT